MKEKNITIVSRETPRKIKSDLDKLRKLTDAEIEASIADDPDWSDDWNWSEAVLVISAEKESDLDPRRRGRAGLLQKRWGRLSAAHERRAALLYAAETQEARVDITRQRSRSTAATSCRRRGRSKRRRPELARRYDPDGRPDRSDSRRWQSARASARDANAVGIAHFAARTNRRPQRHTAAFAIGRSARRTGRLRRSDAITFAIRCLARRTRRSRERSANAIEIAELSRRTGHRLGVAGLAVRAQVAIVATAPVRHPRVTGRAALMMT